MKQAKKEMPKRYHSNRYDMVQAVAAELQTCRDVKGRPQNDRAFVAILCDEGLPDVLTVEGEDVVWSAQWYAGEAARYLRAPSALADRFAITNLLPNVNSNIQFPNRLRLGTDPDCEFLEPYLVESRSKSLAGQSCEL